MGGLFVYTVAGDSSGGFRNSQILKITIDRPAEEPQECAAILRSE